MFDFTHKHKRLIQIVLAIIFLPFAFFGVDSYFRHREGGQSVATVGGHEISQQEFAKALQERQRSIQRMLQGRVDPAMLDNPELRSVTLEGLVQRRVLLDHAFRSNMVTSDAQLRSTIGEVPLFQDDSGKFSLERYQQFLKSEGETEASFEARMRQDLILQQLADGYAGSALVPRTVAERVTRLAEQQREVSRFVIHPDQFTSRVKIEPSAASKYYEVNRSEFEIPEQVRLDYVVLSLDELAQQVRLDPAEVTKYYESRRPQLEKRETRARHILIAVDSGAGAEAEKKARATAEDLYQRVKKNPDAFPELAKQFSQDPGSAAKGGDLGFLTRGSMKDVPEFEEALFKLKEGEISPPVETKLGFHIIQATEVRAARGKSLEEMRAQIEAELRKQAASRTFAELADKFNNTVYEQSESLKPAAELLKTTPRRSAWVTRAGAGENLLNNARLLQAVFSDDVLKNGRNTEAIEVAPGTLAAARVAEHKAAAIRPFDQVREAIEKKLVLGEATRLAAQDGKAKLERLKQGKDDSTAWEGPKLVSRSDFKSLPEPVVRQAFKADSAKLPAYAGVEDAQGDYTLIKVTRIVDAKDSPPERGDSIAETLRRTLGQEELAGLVAGLKQKAGVTIRKELLEKKER